MGNKVSPSSLPSGSWDINNAERADRVQFSPEQVEDLLNVLDNTRYMLESSLLKTQHSNQSRRAGSWWAFHCFPRRRRSIAKYIFFITATLQAMNLLVVSVIDVWPKRDDQSVMIGTGITMILLQVINLFFIVMVSVRLVKQLKKHKVSVLLLAQSYVSTLMLFAGLYTLTYRLEPKSWKFIQEELEKDPILVIVLYSKFLFFSVSTATLCGWCVRTLASYTCYITETGPLPERMNQGLQGLRIIPFNGSDNVLPQEWYNCLCTAVQMLMSFVYFASILGQTLSQDTQYWLEEGPNDHVPPCDRQSQSSSCSSARTCVGCGSKITANDAIATRKSCGDGGWPRDGVGGGKEHLITFEDDCDQRSINSWESAVMTFT